MNKNEQCEALKRDMLEAITSGGCWFCTRKNKYVKIGYDEVDGVIFARECHLKDDGMEGGAYTFAMDWFDLSVRPRSIDIYADAESFESWDIWYDSQNGTCNKTREDGRDPSLRLINFCARADQEALAGLPRYYTINSTNFDKIQK